LVSSLPSFTLTPFLLPLLMIQARFNSPLKTLRPGNSYSRSTKVLEQLQGNLESIQAEIENTKNQLKSAVEAKEIKDRENENYIEANKELRANIQEVMQILESKQESLDTTKKTHHDTESQVKQLKSEAMAARRELDDLKRKEDMIERERQMIQIQKERHAQHHASLAKSVGQCQAEFNQDMEVVQLEMRAVEHEIERVKALDLVKIVQKSIQKQAKQRKMLMEEFAQIQADIQGSNQSFMDHIKNELITLLNEVPIAEEGVMDQVTHCQEDFYQLMSKIKANTILS